jgi:aryl-alcohol dehydrogenase-like predicted oxidoreductase
VIREWVKKSNLVSVMMQYSLLDRRPEETVLDMLHQNTISVIARGPVAKGLLSSKPAATFQDYRQEDIVKIQHELEALTTPQRTKAQIALRYALSHPAVATVIPGASKLEQLEENVKPAQLSPDELVQLRNMTRANLYDAHR